MIKSIGCNNWDKPDFFICHSYGYVTITRIKLQILSYKRPLSSESSLVCYIMTPDIRLYGHLQGTMTLTPVAKHLAKELPLH